eukprot:1385799-Pyramimonas_sp.AAC.1
MFSAELRIDRGSRIDHLPEAYARRGPAKPGRRQGIWEGSIQRGAQELYLCGEREGPRGGPRGAEGHGHADHTSAPS